MTDFVRVKSKTTGHEHTTSRRNADANPDFNIIPNKPAVNLNGDPLPPKYLVKANPANPASTATNTSEEDK